MPINDDPTGSQNAGISDKGAVQQKRLTKITKRVLDVVYVMTIVGLVVWPVVVLGVGQNILTQSTSQAVTAFLGFRIDHNAVQAMTGVDSPGIFIHGHCPIEINTPGKLSWFLTGGFIELFAVFGFFVLTQIRAVLNSLSKGVSFSSENAVSIRKAGIAILCWQILAPFLQFFSGSAVLSDLEPSLDPPMLYPAFELNIAGFLVGVAAILLSYIFLEATSIQKDHSLTI